MKVLIIRFSEISDILHTTPVLRSLKNKYPEGKIHYLVKTKYAGLLQANPHIDKLISFDGDLRDTVLDLLEEDYNYVLDLQNSFRSWNITAMLKQAFNSNVKVYRVKKGSFRKMVYSFSGLNLFSDASVAVRYLALVKKIGGLHDGQGLDYDIPTEEEIDHKDLPMSHSAGYISFVISGALDGAKLPLDKWKTLCEEIDYPIIIQGTANEAANGDKLKQIDPIRIYNSCGKFSMHESADIIRYAKVVVAHESDLMHIATAYKRKIVALMETRSVLYGRYPYYGFNNLKGMVSPDLRIFKGKSFRGHLNLNTDRIVDAVNHFLMK